jgi:hypothetical protein
MAGRRTMERRMVPEIKELYRGCEITWPETRIHSAFWSVNLASNDPNLLSQALVFNDGSSLEGAKAQARRFVDEHIAHGART